MQWDYVWLYNIIALLLISISITNKVDIIVYENCNIGIAVSLEIYVL